MKFFTTHDLEEFTNMMVIIACLGQLCITEAHTVAPVTISGSSCIMAAPQILVNFQTANPEWVVKHWSCENGR